MEYFIYIFFAIVLIAVLWAHPRIEDVPFKDELGPPPKTPGIMTTYQMKDPDEK